jgi:hypothetical protein
MEGFLKKLKWARESLECYKQRSMGGFGGG